MVAFSAQAQMQNNGLTMHIIGLTRTELDAASGMQGLPAV